MKNRRGLLWGSSFCVVYLAVFSIAARETVWAVSDYQVDRFEADGTCSAHTTGRLM